MKGFVCTSLILRTSLKFVVLNFVVGYNVKRTAGIQYKILLQNILLQNILP